MDDWLRQVVENNVAICQIGLELLQELARETKEEEKNSKQRKLEQKSIKQRKLEERNEDGHHNIPVQAHLREPNFKEHFDTSRFYMTEDTFGELCALLGPSHRHEGFSREAAVAIALEYLTSGGREKQLALAYKVTKTMLSILTTNICVAVCDALAVEYMPAWTEENLLRVAEGYEREWMFPHCVGAITMHALATSQDNHVVALIAVCDANYHFTKLAIDTYDQSCRINIFTNLQFGERLFSGAMPFPSDGVLHKEILPYFLVGSESQPHCKRIMRAFGIKRKTLRSDPQCLFNYRLERARRCVDTAYGILITRWKCIQRLQGCSPQHSQYLVNACGLLHNFLLTKSRALYCQPEYSGYEDHNGVWVDGTWRQHVSADLRCRKHLPGFRSGTSTYARFMRNLLKNYFNSPEGALPLQRYKLISQLFAEKPSQYIEKRREQYLFPK